MKKTLALVCAFTLAVSTVSAVANDPAGTQPRISEEIVSQNATSAAQEANPTGIFIALTVLMVIAAIANGSSGGSTSLSYVPG